MNIWIQRIWRAIFALFSLSILMVLFIGLYKYVHLLFPKIDLWKKMSESGQLIGSIATAGTLIWLILDKRRDLENRYQERLQFNVRENLNQLKEILTERQCLRHKTRISVLSRQIRIDSTEYLSRTGYIGEKYHHPLLVEVSSVVLEAIGELDLNKLIDWSGDIPDYDIKEMLESLQPDLSTKKVSNITRLKVAEISCKLIKKVESDLKNNSENPRIKLAALRNLCLLLSEVLAYTNFNYQFFLEHRKLKLTPIAFENNPDVFAGVANDSNLPNLAALILVCCDAKFRHRIIATS
ncbi:hypothetical protein [Rheinheimera tangshanensis]|uniref:Uncharacterized protein n=1 Tax=Rheinheimera tangshanensis TaxID=400153 RepID=A0A5C8LU00_9GAMM|nr:hypothetical protein [Rheinheimera tangshanensis]TXK80811.1 hypothetical protein FU839_10175 [Rheinheimera tangshanensis]